MKLINERTGTEIKIGDVVKTFRGEAATLVGMAEPRSENSTGRVYLRRDGVTDALYPSVIDAKWIKED